MVIKITIAAIRLLVIIVTMVTSATTLVIKVRNSSGKVSYFCASKPEMNLKTNFSKNHRYSFAHKSVTELNGQEQERELTTHPIESQS